MTDILSSRAARAAVALAFAAGALAGCGERRAEAPTVALGPLGDSLPTTWYEITDGAWLGGSRYAVVSPADRVVAVVDFGAPAITPVGSAAELGNPSGVFAKQDTLFVADWGKRRLTAWGPAGRLLRSWPAPDAARGALPQARDAAGQFYAELYPAPSPSGSGARDSAAVLRLDPALTRADTIARLAPLDVAEVQTNEGKHFERRVFSGQDRWGVLQDGTLWIARVYQNRVDWVSPDGKRVTKGEALPDRVLEVTRVDRELFKREFPPELRQRAEELAYSAIKPPFVRAFTGGDGRVWLEKSRAVSDTTQRYQLVDRQGRLVAELHVPGKRRILAVAADGEALVTENTPAGARVMRARVPELGGTAGGSGGR
ncbi:MAG TPA: hypothetical protein VFS40_10970 [Gemmatimonadales bacterium]|nr:hypothetical protein [Gemmatimonadales bacterium]